METPSAPPLPVENVYNEKAVEMQSGPIPAIPAVPAVLMAEAEPIEEVDEAPYSPLYTSASSGISSLIKFDQQQYMEPIAYFHSRGSKSNRRTRSSSDDQ